MCGIVAYIGKRNALPVIVKGLKRLEYRGYDSAGIALLLEKEICIYKKKGKVSNLEIELNDKKLSSSIGIGHTRWATHGEPNDLNAHPHYSRSRRLAIVHNGIIENYIFLKQKLIEKGYDFQSQTDSEVLINYIEDIQLTMNCSLEKAVRYALNEVIGAYAIVIIDREMPNQLIAARKGSPLVIGIGDNEFFFASDMTPIIEYTNQVIYLDDYEIAKVSDNVLVVQNSSNEYVKPNIQTVELELEAIEKSGYEHFMLKEIFEQPTSIANSIRGRLNSKESTLHLGDLGEYLDVISKANRITIVACGTSWHAGLVGEYLLETLARINVEVDYASEFRYRNPIINKDDIIIAVSQSGETADTIAALELAKSKGATILGVCNVIGSTISRITNANVYTHAGPEIGVASTKAFTAQVSVLTMIAIAVARKKGTINNDLFRELIIDLEAIPSKIEKILNNYSGIKKISNHFALAYSFIFLGRGVNFPVALEGALKLKEVSYIHAEGYPAAEMKHGPIALIDENMPVLFIATNDNLYEKVISNIQEVKARKGKVIAIVTEGDNLISQMADFTIEVPKTNDLLLPLLTSIPLQILSYSIALARGCNVDQPRNLAKSVTVE